MTAYADPCQIFAGGADIDLRAGGSKPLYPAPFSWWRDWAALGGGIKVNC